MNVKELINFLKRYDENLKIEAGEKPCQMLFLLNKNDSCQATIILKTEVLKK